MSYHLSLFASGTAIHQLSLFTSGTPICHMLNVCVLAPAGILPRRSRGHFAGEPKFLWFAVRTYLSYSCARTSMVCQLLH